MDKGNREMFEDQIVKAAGGVDDQGLVERDRASGSAGEAVAVLEGAGALDVAVNLEVVAGPSAAPATGADPVVSVVIPVYNEETILEQALLNLRQDITQNFDWRFEILVAENGSTDNTLSIARRMAAQYPEISVLSAGEPNYGLALRKGILESRGTFVICDEIDLCDVGFYQRALERLQGGADMVVGSKLLAESRDARPFIRHVASHSFNLLLRMLAGFKGTDTHGLKAFNRERIVPVVQTCLVNKDVFASELVIRAERRKMEILEIPLDVTEKRAPSIKLFRRVPRVLKDLWRLTIAMRLGR